MARPTCPMCREAHHRLGGAPALASLATRGGSPRARGTRLRRSTASGLVEVLGHLLDEVALDSQPSREPPSCDQELLHH